MTDCCNDSPLVTIDQCYTFPKETLKLSNYGTACGCCGETYILADLSGKSSKNCIRLRIDDAAPLTPTPFSLEFKVGCTSHKISFCNLPPLPADWASFVYTVLATDGILLTENVGITLVSFNGRSIEIQLCGDCKIEVTSGLPTNPLVTIKAEALASTSTAPKLGSFLSYAFPGGVLSGVQTYSGFLYAGFLSLGADVPLDACCLPETCSCTAIGGCRTILLTGKARIPLAKPFPVPTLGAPIALAYDPATGNIIATDIAVAPYLVFDKPHTIVMTPDTIGSTLITVVLH